MDPVITQIRQDLKDNTDPGTQKSFRRFFREEVQYYGVKTAAVGKIAQKYWKEIKSRDKKEIFQLCEELYSSHYTEEAFIVSNWVPRLQDRYEREDFLVFYHWIDTYISNWAMCDGFCNHSMGDFIEKFPEYIGESETLDNVREPVGPACFSGITYYPCKTGSVSRRSARNRSTAPHRHR